LRITRRDRLNETVRSIHNKKGLGTCFKDGKWTVASINKKKRAMETTGQRCARTSASRTSAVTGQCSLQEDMEKKIPLPTTYDQYTKQHRVETSGSSLIVILKMMEERKGLDKSKTCCLYGLWPRKPIDSELFVFVSVNCCLLLFCDDSVIYTVLSASCSSLLSFLPIKPLDY